jgi:cysteine-rich repeat protein
MRHASSGARLSAVISLSILLAPAAGYATTIAQNSAWTVTRPGATQTLRVVAYGDSIYAGYTGATTIARRAGPYVTAEYCAAVTGQNVNVARRCQSGGVAQDVYNRINSTTDRAFMADASTRIVTFEMCGNDYLQARSSFKSASGTCNYAGLNTALANCKNYTQLAMNSINTYAHANTKLKIVSNLYYPGYNADNSFSTCTDLVNGDPANGFRVNMRNLFLPRLLESNWWTCKYAADKGFVCTDAFATYMARDYDSNGDGIKDADAIRYKAGESLADYQARILALASTLRDSNTKLVNSTSSFDYLQSDDTHPTFEGATAGTLFTTPSGNNGVFHATTGAYADGKNPRWNQNGHDRLGWAINPACPFALVQCGNGVMETDWLPSGDARTEACDDGNAANGDGCSSTCAVETGHSCSGAPSTCAPVCGDGMLAGGEQCDDSDAESGDGCSATCTVEPGFSCMGGPSTCQYICGDGLIVTGEGCDDGDLDADDGCAADCTTEEGWTCAGEPSACSPVCGDGLVLGSEECDESEANGSAAGCCSEACSFKLSGASCDDGQICTDGDSCDGANTCNSGGPLDCSDGNVCTDEVCDPDSGCEYTNNTAGCDDENACTVDDTCAEGSCISGSPRDCNDDNVCTDEVCEPATGCEYTNNTDPCTDGSVCTLDDTCADGGCVSGAPLDCGDGNVCTDDSCDAVEGCGYASNTAPCDDGNACTAPDVCGASQCVSGPPVYSFSGFQSPVDNYPVVNNGKAGRAYPVKWTLPLCSGGNVTRLDAVLYNPLRIRQVNCDTSAPLDQLETETTGVSGLSVTADGQYHYNWKTDATFAGKCYELLLELDNGTTQVARFKFTK